MRLRGRLRKVLFWGFLFVGAVLGGALAFAYSYITDSDTLAALIRREAPRYLPTSVVRVDRVLLKPLIGDVELKQTNVWQTIDGRPFAAVTVPWIQVRSDFRSILWGKVSTREVNVAQPRLRITRREDGSWNLKGLLADPWPQANLPRPVVVISRGEVELVDGKEVVPILRDVSLRVEPLADGSYRFEGDARSDLFDHAALEGTFHPRTGKVVLRKGDLRALAINDALRHRVPAEYRPALQAIGLERGDVDVSVVRLERDPKAVPPLRYEVDVKLGEGAFKCPKLPFPLADVTASATLTQDTCTVHNAGGRDGKTEVRVRESRFSAADPAGGPMDLVVEVDNLELDERLRAKTPEKLLGLWRDFLPRGRANLGQVSAVARASRAVTGGPIRHGVDVKLLDVAVQYRHFPYPLEHIQGTLAWEGPTLVVDASTVVGRKPLTARGTIENPGPLAEVDLKFLADDLPVDETLLNALPPEARKVVEEFRPEGAVRGWATLRRVPDPGDPKGKVRVDAELDLNPGSAVRWKGLPYPVRDLSGHLSLHPHVWTFTDMKGKNGLAQLQASGQVKEVSKGVLDVDVQLHAQHLPFDDQLRLSLPPEWRKTWGVLNPTGSAAFDARIVLKPGVPGDYKFLIRPEADTRVHLTLTPAPGTEVPGRGGVIELPAMENVSGKFFFDNGRVQMEKVRFDFRQAPVEFETGYVVLKDTGSFDLHVDDLWVKRLRLESELRKVMPPMMAQVARRLDDGKTFEAKGNLDIAWSGLADAPAVCSWDHAKVIFNDNKIEAGLPLEHLQGEVNDISGRSDGRSLTARGVLQIVSVSVRGQHFSDVESPVTIGPGKAELASLKGKLLGGTVFGAGEVTLDATPRYKGWAKLAGARLEEYARTVPGHQDIKGEVSGSIEFSGLGHDLKSLEAKGDAHVSRGDLGKLPLFDQLKKILGLAARRPLKAAVFDAADVAFTIDNGRANLNPIKVTSNALNLQGAGTVDSLGTLDLRFYLVPLRGDKVHIPILPSVAGELFAVHVSGPAGAAQIKPQFLPSVTRGAGAVAKKFGRRDDRR